MKTKEFIKQVRSLGYEVNIKYSEMIISLTSKICVRIDLNRQFGIITYPENFGNNGHRLFVICMEYARMPVEAREEEEKFYLQKMKSFYEARKDEESMFLTLVINYNFFLLSGMRQCQNYQTQFTQKEIDKIKETQHTDLAEFKQIPVEEVKEE